ncbi:MAG: beta-ketoacyl synthase, partial [Rivularia sp. ALOHA_DT_140]|nr:beta-ketoacyl synthase [Rivularia sp. ALOHA_DT_140]
MSNALNSSTLFGDRLSGEKNAVREFWQLPPVEQSPDNNFWCNYVLIAKPSQVRESLVGENRVYLTQINTPEEVVIAGEPVACERVIKKLGCNAFRAPFDHVIHCKAMASEHKEIARVNTLPIQENQQNLILYSAAKYAPIELESKTIAEGIATGLCKELDFPRLVDQVYQDGAKIFIETGAGNVCSRWIDKNLSDKEHMTISLNRRGLDDHSSILKALAKLTSNQVSLYLSPLYSTVEETSQKVKISHKKVTLGGHNIIDNILTAENKELFKNQVETSLKLVEKSELAEKTNTTVQAIAKSDLAKKIAEPIKAPQQLETIVNKSGELSKKSEVTPMKKSAVSSIEKETNLSKAPTKITKQNPSITINKLASTQSVSNYIKPQYQQVNLNNLMVHKTHSVFLQYRQDFSQQLSEIIQLQIACAENLFEN